MSARIISITYKPQDVEPHPPDHYARIPIEDANLVEGYGIEGDRKGGHPKCQINIMSQEALNQLKADGFQTEPGQMGEQLIVEGLDVNTLAAGTQLRLGESALLEIVEPRTGCDRFKKIQGYEPAQAKGQMGMIAKVIASGKISLNDSVEVV